MRKPKIIALSLCALLMLLSFLVTPPTGEMVVALRWDGFAMITLMMIVIAGLEKEGALSSLETAASTFGHTLSIVAFFVLAAFVLSPFVSSLFAVAAILPMAKRTLERKERAALVPTAAALIALSSSAGGMLLPAGSIQNMLLHKTLENDFISTMLPLFLLSIPVILLSILALCSRHLREKVYINDSVNPEQGPKGIRMMYITLVFVLMMASFSLFAWVDILIFTIVVLLIFDRKVFSKTDWFIPLSVIFLSMAGASLEPLISSLFESGSIFKSAILAEIIGPATAAALLGEAVPGIEVIKGVNIGGFGTIASPCCLIALSYLEKGERKKMILRYTIPAIVLLVALSVYVSFA